MAESFVSYTDNDGGRLRRWGMWNGTVPAGLVQLRVRFVLNEEPTGLMMRFRLLFGPDV